METKNEEIVCKFWQFFNDQKWREAEALLAEDFVAVWRQSKERFVGAKNFVAVNENYGGTHQIEVVQTSSTSTGDVISEVRIQSDMPDGKHLDLYAISFFAFKNGEIASVREYWADTYPAPANRKQWVAPWQESDS
jgi:ketosteroid isomerase-like protein